MNLAIVCYQKKEKEIMNKSWLCLRSFQERMSKKSDITDRKELHLRYTSAFDCLRNLVVRSKKNKMMRRDVAFAVLVPSTMRKA